jgi:hypothetical protein
MCRATTAALATAAVLAGCGSVTWDRSKVQNAVRDVLPQQAHLRVKSVACPDNAKIAKGVVSYCTATLTNADTVRFSATQTDSSGHVHVGPVEMIATMVENTMRSNLQGRGISATPTCPQHVPVAVGQTFICTLSLAGGRSARVQVTVADTGGGFTTKVVR